MNINTSFIKTLIEFAVQLDDEYQLKAISAIISLIMEQKAKKELNVVTTKKGMQTEASADAIESKKLEYKKRISHAFTDIEKMNNDQRAQLAMFIEKMHPGSMNKRDDITITINSKNISLKEYVESLDTEMDYAELKASLDKYKT